MKILRNIKKLTALGKAKVGQVFDNMAGIFVGLAALMITAVVVFLLMSQTATNTLVAADTNASGAINTLQAAGDDTVNFVPLVVIAAIGAILLGLVALFRRR